MKVFLITHGSRGDIQPFLALAKALGESGHEVILAAPAAYSSVAKAHSASVVALDDGPNHLVKDHRAREAIERNFHGLRGKVLGIDLIRKNRALMARVLDDLAAMVNTPTQIDNHVELVVHPAHLPGHEIAERLEVPSVAVSLQPLWVPTESFPNPILPVPIPRALNRASYGYTTRLLRLLNGNTRRWRIKTLRLPPRRRHYDSLRSPGGESNIVLQAFSRHVLPDGAAYADNVHTTGYWYLPPDEAWAPAPELVDFLESGEPPIYIGFGSLVGRDPVNSGAIIANAVRNAGVRAVIATGRGGIQPSLRDDKHVFCVDEAPHSWLFDQMSAVVHHGGAGTTGAALAAGKPQVICHFMFDQPYFGERMHSIGVGPPPQPQRYLNSEQLQKAITRAVTDTAIRSRAEEVAHLVRSEGGVTNAVKILESIASEPDPRHNRYGIRR